uniref:Uncharacterized protein n=1 Tax=Arundo donax TaxID=35708 RepID=A0A0A9BUN9_ARUDO
MVLIKYFCNHLLRFFLFISNKTNESAMLHVSL